MQARNEPARRPRPGAESADARDPNDRRPGRTASGKGVVARTRGTAQTSRRSFRVDSPSPAPAERVPSVAPCGKAILRATAGAATIPRGTGTGNCALRGGPDAASTRPSAPGRRAKLPRPGRGRAVGSRCAADLRQVGGRRRPTRRDGRGLLLVSARRRGFRRHVGAPFVSVAEFVGVAAHTPGKTHHGDAQTAGPASAGIRSDCVVAGRPVGFGSDLQCRCHMAEVSIGHGWICDVLLRAWLIG